jgi:hypothetical protein
MNNVLTGFESSVTTHYLIDSSTSNILFCDIDWVFQKLKKLPIKSSFDLIHVDGIFYILPKKYLYKTDMNLNFISKSKELSGGVSLSQFYFKSPYFDVTTSNGGSEKILIFDKNY